MTCHHIGGAVSHENDVHTGLVHNRGHGVVVGCEHGDFLAALLHLMHHLCGDAFGFLCTDMMRRYGSDQTPKREIHARLAHLLAFGNAVFMHVLEVLHHQQVSMAQPTLKTFLDRRSRILKVRVAPRLRLAMLVGSISIGCLGANPCCPVHRGTHSPAHRCSQLRQLHDPVGEHANLAVQGPRWP